MKAETQAMRAKVVEAEAEIPLAIAEAFRSGNLGVMDYYHLKNIQADTEMRGVDRHERRRRRGAAIAARAGPTAAGDRRRADGQQRPAIPAARSTGSIGHQRDVMQAGRARAGSVAWLAQAAATRPRGGPAPSSRRVRRAARASRAGPGGRAARASAQATRRRAAPGAGGAARRLRPPQRPRHAAGGRSRRALACPGPRRPEPPGALRRCWTRSATRPALAPPSILAEILAPPVAPAVTPRRAAQRVVAEEMPSITSEATFDLGGLSDPIRLCGHRDQNLNALEALIPVVLRLDGDRVHVSGDERRCAAPRSVLRAMLAAARSGTQVTPDDVALAARSTAATRGERTGSRRRSRRPRAAARSVRRPPVSARSSARSPRTR